MIKTALISVSNKDGLEELLETLAKYNVKIISSGGTAARIRELGYKGELVEVSEYTGYPESPGGYVKTLHPKIHGGLLLDKKNPEHSKYMRENGIEHIDLIVSNLYPFEETVAKADVTREEAFENIDIGGPALVRAAAKGALLHKDVTIVTHPTQYKPLIDDMEESKGSVGIDTMLHFAEAAFKRIKKYDSEISKYIDKIIRDYVRESLRKSEMTCYD